jgi:hypothetical protein
MRSKTSALGVKKNFEISSEIYKEDILKQAISDFKEFSNIIFNN